MIIKNKEKYENPRIVVFTFEKKDIVTLSDEIGNGPEFELDDLMF